MTSLFALVFIMIFICQFSCSVHFFSYSSFQLFKKKNTSAGIKNVIPADVSILKKHFLISISVADSNISVGLLNMDSY